MAEGLGQGAAPYKPHHQRQEEKLSQEKGDYRISTSQCSVCSVLKILQGNCCRLELLFFSLRYHMC